MLHAQAAAALTAQPKYFRSAESGRYLEGAVQGDVMSVRVWWDEDDAGDAVIFHRTSVYNKDEYLYVAIDWDHKSIVSTAFASTDKAARRAILEDLNRRGWNFHTED